MADDLLKVWHLILAVLHAAFQWIFWFATTSSAGVGIGLIAFGALVKFYQRRRAFYGGINVAADWEPRYGDIVRGRVVDFGLRWTFGLTVLLGLTVLWNWWLPKLFQGIFGFLVEVTG